MSNESLFVEAITISGLLRKLMIEKARQTRRTVYENNRKAMGNFAIPIIAGNTLLTIGLEGNT